jgi:hypothetical protein
MQASVRDISDNTFAADGSIQRTRLPSSVRVAIYILFGLLETVLAYIIFDRADDHAAFLAAVRTGVDETGTISPATVVVLYSLSFPVRLFGGQELLFILWFRAIALVGFLAAFEWVYKVVNSNVVISTSDLNRARLVYMTLILLCPGITAWTASILRDGVAITLFFFAAYAWSCRRRVTGAALMTAALLLRPQHALFVAIFGLMLIYGRIFRRAKRPWILLAVLCVSLSLLGFDYRAEVSEIFSPAFGEFQAYPTIDSYLDFAGFSRLVVQGLIDPISVASPGSARAFGILEAAFFMLALLASIGAMSTKNRRLRQLMISSLLTLWAFAYFEVFVSGFSRHRLAPLAVLLACIAIAPGLRSFELAGYRRQVRANDG